jgi:hypothetical protein
MSIYTLLDYIDKEILLKNFRKSVIYVNRIYIQ